MPFDPGEEINVRFVGDPATAALTFRGNELTVANGGLELKRDGGLIAILRLPRHPGVFPYTFADTTGVVETGNYRVTGAQSRRAARGTVQQAEPPSGVQPRRLGGR